MLGEQHAAAAAAAERAAVLAQQQLGAARCELAALRTDLAALREELVWAFAARELSASTPGTLTVLPGTAGRAASAGTG